MKFKFSSFSHGSLVREIMSRLSMIKNQVRVGIRLVRFSVRYNLG